MIIITIQLIYISKFRLLACKINANWWCPSKKYCVTLKFQLILHENFLIGDLVVLFGDGGGVNHSIEKLYAMRIDSQNCIC